MASTSKDLLENSETITVARLNSIHGVPQGENAIDPNINIAGGTEMNGENDHPPHSHVPVPAMEDDVPVLPAVQAGTAGNTTPEVMAMDTLSMTSPFSSPSPVQPVRTAQKRGPSSGTPRSSRAPSLAARWSSREPSPARARERRSCRSLSTAQ